MKEFGIEWEETPIFSISGVTLAVDSYKFSNPEYGEIDFILSSGRMFSAEPADYYKYLAIIYEQNLKKKTIIVCPDDFCSQVINGLGLNYKNFCVVGVSNFLNLYPRTIEERKKRIVKNLFNISSDFGTEFNDLPLETFFVKNQTEEVYFLKLLSKTHVVSMSSEIIQDLDESYEIPRIMIDYAGWELIEQEQKKQQKSAFIAMSFSKDLDLAGKKIIQAITESGFDAKKVNEEQFNSDITGQIYFDIVRSRFVVADATEQKNGVYYEAGYATGLDKPVIWTCKEEDFKNVHFDTNHKNYILWKTEEDLYAKLLDRIKGTILLKDDI